MTLEAATQASELEGIDAPPISDFYSRVIHPDAPLLVPESSGVEILFSVHPAKLSLKIYHQTLHDFTLSLVVNVTGSDTSPDGRGNHARVGNEAPGMPLVRLYCVQA